MFKSSRALQHSYSFYIAIVVYALIVGLAPLNALIAQEEAPSSQDAVELFNQGQDEHAKGNFAKAIELYDKAIKIVPEFAEAEYQKGNAFLAVGDPNKAETAFRRAIELRADWTLPMVALGTVLENRGDQAEAEKVLTKAIAIDDSSFPAYSALVRLKLRTNAAAEVLTLLLSKVRAFASKANAGAVVFSTEASLENALKDRAAAKKSIERALSLDPNFKPALFLKANIALDENDLVLADAIARSLERLEQNSEDVIVLRARVLIASGKPDDAVKMLASIKSPSEQTKQLIQNVSLMTEQLPENLLKLIEGQPKNAVALGRLCTLYRVSDPAKALDYCHRAFDVEPNNLDHAIGYGAALVQAHRFEDAVTVLSRLKAVAADNSTVRANLGTALFELKRYAEAKAEYEWLTTRPQVAPIAYYFLAICHDQLGEYMDAGANYNLFLKFADPVQNKDEIDKVKFRIPSLETQIKQQNGRSKSKSGK